MMTFAQTVEALRTAGLNVIAGQGLGAPMADGIDIVLTQTNWEGDGSADLNGIVARKGGLAYVRRSGEVWLLHAGPLTGGRAVIFVGAENEDAVNEVQADAVKVLLAVLGEALDSPEPERGSSPMADLDPDAPTQSLVEVDPPLTPQQKAAATRAAKKAAAAEKEQS